MDKTEPISVVKALQHFFTEQPHGRKIEMAEFKALSQQDKVDFRNMLIEAGWNVQPLASQQ